MAKTKLTKGERAFRKQYDGAAIDEEELASAAEEVPGPLGDAARALINARAVFELELERIGYKHG